MSLTPPPLDLTGHRALVLGASQGIGRATAESFASLGASLTLVARTEEKLRAVAEELSSAGETPAVLPLDLDDPAAVKKALADLIAQHGPHTIVVNNSGGPPAGPLYDADPEEFIPAMTRHVIASQIVAQATVPGMKERGYGRIINVVSTSVYEPIPNLGVSNCTRGAVASWAKTLSKELGSFGITVNCVLPGFTDTERLGSLISGRATREDRSEEAVAETMRSLIPAARFARPREVADAIAFLASPAGGYINGVCLPVDGGRLASI